MGRVPNRTDGRMQIGIILRYKETETDAIPAEVLQKLAKIFWTWTLLMPCRTWQRVGSMRSSFGILRRDVNGVGFRMSSVGNVLRA
jgi:hypothetical protein